MKKTLKIFFSLATVLLLFSNSAYAKDTFDKKQKEIVMIKPSSLNEAIKIHNSVYEGNPAIQNAAPAESGSNGGGLISIEAVSLPYNFTFDFDSTLTSTSISHPSSGTITITATGNWEEPDEYQYTPLDYYDITLYAGSTSQGTVRYRTGVTLVGTWSNVPSGNISFVMTKHRDTWSTPDWNGDISGSGVVE